MNDKGILNSITSKIILVNIIIFILITIASLFIDANKLIYYLALQPSSILKGERLWTIITSMFVHFQVWHLFVNMFSLYFIGTFVEKLVGKKRFLIFYILAGIFAGIFWVLLSGYLAINPFLTNILGNPEIFGVGASGALFGLVGILAVLTPHAKVFLILGPIVAIIFEATIFGIFQQYGLSEIQPYSSILSLVEIIIFVYFIFALFSIMSFNPRTRRIALPIELEMWILPIVAIAPLIIISAFVNLPIGNIAHLGGLLVGLIYAFYIKTKFPKKSKMIAKMFSG
jgi:membrane associated rhomboid family serine protease